MREPSVSRTAAKHHLVLETVAKEIDDVANRTRITLIRCVANARTILSKRANVLLAIPSDDRTACLGTSAVGGTFLVPLFVFTRGEYPPGLFSTTRFTENELRTDAMRPFGAAKRCCTACLIACG